MPQSKRSRRAGGEPTAPRVWQDSRPRIDPKDVCVGCIVWLPPRPGYEIRVACDGVDCDAKLDDAGYSHPVVIVRIRQREGSYTPGDIICSVACITTFGDTSFFDYIEKRPQLRNMQQSIPILETDSDITAAAYYHFAALCLESGTLHKQSYVKTQHTYAVPVSSLRQYNHRVHQAYTRRLSAESCTLLISKLGLEKQIYTPTCIVATTAALRLKVLASTGGMIKESNTDSHFHAPTPHNHRGRPYRPKHQRRKHTEAYWLEDYDLNWDPLSFCLSFRQTLAVFLFIGSSLWWYQEWDLPVYAIAGLLLWWLRGRNAVVHLAIAPLHWWILQTLLKLTLVFPEGGWWMLVKIVVFLYFAFWFCLYLPVLFFRLVVGRREPKLS